MVKLIIFIILMFQRFRFFKYPLASSLSGKKGGKSGNKNIKKPQRL
jgi:hypothetical protein